MSDKKYYVKLKEEFQATGVTFADMRLYLDENGAFDHFYVAHAFTKAELAEIKDGAFYQKPVNMDSWTTGFQPNGYIYNEIDKTYEYTNPLIELVPVEEEE